MTVGRHRVSRVRVDVEQDAVDLGDQSFIVPPPHRRQVSVAFTMANGVAPPQAGQEVTIDVPGHGLSVAMVTRVVPGITGDVSTYEVEADVIREFPTDVFVRHPAHLPVIP